MPSHEQPRRVSALAIALFAPFGTGHFYLGAKRRAVAWFAVIWLSLLCGPFLSAALGGSSPLPSGLGGAVVLAAALWALSAIDILLLARRRTAPPSSGSVLFFALVGLAPLGLALVMLRLFVFVPYKIPAGSMMPTLLVGDHIFVDKLAFGARAPERGEVIVFEFPEKPQYDFVKRVIAGPGDTLAIRNGRPILNGWEVPHCKVGAAELPSDGDGHRSRGDLEVEFLDGYAYLTFYDEASASFTEMQGPFYAAPGEYWVVGDNRNNSHDSRMWFGLRGGGVPEKRIKGRAAVIWLSASGEQLDWSRVGSSLAEPTLPASLRHLQPDLDRCLLARPAHEQTVPPRR
jgi:signal peptidase I